MIETISSSTSSTEASFGSAAPESQWTDITVLDDSDWLGSAMKRIAALAQLNEDWDGYGSPPPEPFLLDMSRTLLQALWRLGMFLPEPAIVPVPGGSVQLEWSFCDRELELELLLEAPDGLERIEYLRSEEDEPGEEGVIEERSELVEHVLWLIEG